MESQLAMSGSVGMRVVRGTVRAPLGWRVRNYSRPGFVWGWLANGAARAFSRITGIPCMIGESYAVLIKADGQRVDYGLLSCRVVTTAFVNFLVDQLQTETSEFGDFKYHDSGVGNTAEAVGDTDMETTDGEDRVAGTQTEGASANIYKSVGTISYTSTKAITECGLFSQSTGATLMDRSVFSAVNVVDGDSIEFTYQITMTAGS